MPLIAFRRYRGVNGLVVAIYVIINAGIAVYGDMLPYETADPDGW